PTSTSWLSIRFTEGRRMNTRSTTSPRAGCARNRPASAAQLSVLSVATALLVSSLPHPAAAQLNHIIDLGNGACMAQADEPPEALGTGPNTIRSHGCALTTAAAILAYYDYGLPEGHAVTPVGLMRLLIKVKRFANNDIDWDNIAWLTNNV